MGNSGEYRGCNRSKPTKSGQQVKTRRRRPSPENSEMTGFAGFAGFFLQGSRQGENKGYDPRRLFFCRVALVFLIPRAGLELLRQGFPRLFPGLPQHALIVSRIDVQAFS